MHGMHNLRKIPWQEVPVEIIKVGLNSETTIIRKYYEQLNILL